MTTRTQTDHTSRAYPPADTYVRNERNTTRAYCYMIHGGTIVLSKRNRLT